MASVQEPCTVKIFVRTPQGKQQPLLNSDITTLATGGGAPDGAATSTTKINERLFIPMSRWDILNDDIIYIEVTTRAGDGIDVSDCIWSIPITLPDGTIKYLAQADFANPATADYTAVANIPVIVAGYKVTEGPIHFGGGVIYLDIQDDTA